MNFLYPSDTALSSNGGVNTVPATRFVVSARKLSDVPPVVIMLTSFSAISHFLSAACNMYQGEVRIPEIATVLPIRSCGLLMSLFVTSVQGEPSQRFRTMTSGSPATAAEI